MSLRDPWLFDIVSRLQTFAGEFAFHADERDACRLALALATSLPRPPDRTHNALLATLLVATAAKISHAMHATVRRRHACDCGRLSIDAIAPMMDWPSSDSRVTFGHWASRYFDAFVASHPPGSAERAARLLRASPQDPWTLSRLARSTHLSAARLRAAFQDSYGLTPHRYLHTVRVLRAIGCLACDETVTATARAVGYRSRKDLYRAFRQVAEVELTAFFSMGAAERSRVAEHLKLTLRPRRAPGRATASLHD